MGWKIQAVGLKEIKYMTCSQLFSSYVRSLLSICYIAALLKEKPVVVIGEDLLGISYRIWLERGFLLSQGSN